MRTWRGFRTMSQRSRANPWWRMDAATERLNALQRSWCHACGNYTVARTTMFGPAYPWFTHIRCPCGVQAAYHVHLLW